jgi:hypothetical protein
MATQCDWADPRATQHPDALERGDTVLGHSGGMLAGDPACTCCWSITVAPETHRATSSGPGAHEGTGRWRRGTLTGVRWCSRWQRRLGWWKGLRQCSCIREGAGADWDTVPTGGREKMGYGWSSSLMSGNSAMTAQNPVAAQGLPGPNLDKRQRKRFRVLTTASDWLKMRCKGELTVGTSQQQEQLERQWRCFFPSSQT